MQDFVDGQLAFDTYLPGAPHELSGTADQFPYDISGQGGAANLRGKKQKMQADARRHEAARRRKSPSCIEEACAYGNLHYLVLLHAQNRLNVLDRKAVYEGSDASPLMWAAFKGHLHIVKFLVSVAMKDCERLTANGEESDGGRRKTPFQATYDLQQQAFSRFINYQSTLGHTALQWAIISGEAAVVRFLLDHNADPFHTDRQGFDAGFVAVQSKQLAILLMLLEDSIAAKAITLDCKCERTRNHDKEGYGVDVADMQDGNRSHNTNEDANSDDDILESAAATYVVDVERIGKVLNDTVAPPPEAAMTTTFVIRKTNYYYLNPALRDVEGHNLLHWAAYRNSPATCQYLVHRWRYDVNAQDTHGRTPLAWAAREGFSEVIEFFCLHGANRLLPDKDGFTAMQYAVARNHPEAAYVLRTAPDTDFTKLDEGDKGSGGSDPRAVAALASYISIRDRRTFGTIRMIATHSIFAFQFVCGGLYMLLSYVSLSMIPPFLSYFPYGIYFFKNMLWTAFAGHPVQSSKQVTRDIGKEAGLSSTLAEAVRGTWLYRLREPANFICVAVMMCLQMFCWTQLGLTPFIHSVFSFNFLFRPTRELATSAVSLHNSPLARSPRKDVTGVSVPCESLRDDLQGRAACFTERLSAFIAEHDQQYRTSVVGSGGTADVSILGSGVNVMSEVRDAHSLLAYSSDTGHGGAATTAGGGDGVSSSPPSTRYLTADQLFSSHHYVGGSGFLGWVFGGDAIRMVATVLPLLFVLTFVFFFLTKITASASAMRYSAINERFKNKRRNEKRSRKAKKKNGPYEKEGSLSSSPVWRILRSRQYDWLHPRALMLERHTQIPSRAFYCPEQDVIVHRYDSYSILLDCPIGRRNHLPFVLGLTCFVLFEFFLFVWGIHQLNFFHGMFSSVACQYESWTAGLFEGLYSAKEAQAALALPNATALSTATHVTNCLPHGGYVSVMNWGWLNSFLNLYSHGLPRKQNMYISRTLLAPYLARSTSLIQRGFFIFYYYWWPTRANLYGTFLLHFAFYSLLMGPAIALRQWSGVWRGATRMELSNPVTPCSSYGGRLIATFPLAGIFDKTGLFAAEDDRNGSNGSTSCEVPDYDSLLTQQIAESDASEKRRGKGSAGGGSGLGGGDSTAAAILCNVDLDEESFYTLTDPAKARRLARNGITMSQKSIYAESSWSIVNVFLFLLGRFGRKWDGAMSVSESLKPVKAPMLTEFL